jgi:hypothetical protein
MIALYVMAGVIVGYFGLDILACSLKVKNTSPLAVSLLMAFVGGVAGHLLWNLVYNT